MQRRGSCAEQMPGRVLYRSSQRGITGVYARVDRPARPSRPASTHPPTRFPTMFFLLLPYDVGVRRLVPGVVGVEVRLQVRG